MSIKSNPKRRYSSDNDITKRKVDFNDYIFLKESFVELGEKYKKLDEDHKKLIKTVKEYQTQISEFQKTKKNINEMFKKIQEKINKNKNIKNIIETKKILELEKEINIKSGEIIKIKEMNLDLENKIKLLEEEINKIKQENKDKDDAIEKMKLKEKKYEDDLKQKENENILIMNKLTELKEEMDNEELLKSSLNNNNETNIKRKILFNNLSIDKNSIIYLLPHKNSIDDKNNILTEEKNILRTNSRKSDTNSSTNKNKIEIIKNINTNNSWNNINEIILNNYLNTINVGYNAINDINNSEQEKDDNIIEDKNIECEPIPSFIYCIKKKIE